MNLEDDRLPKNSNRVKKDAAWRLTSSPSRSTPSVPRSTSTWATRSRSAARAASCCRRSPRVDGGRRGIRPESATQACWPC